MAAVGAAGGTDEDGAKDAALDEAALLRRAVALGVDSAGRDGGGPFGSVVAVGGRIVGEGVNRVTGTPDPTAHAEIEAIRAAAATLGTNVLVGAVIYASCEPCPMCLAACYWARVDTVVFAADRYAAAAVGFDDAFLHDELAMTPADRRLHVRHVDGVDGVDGGAPFAAWVDNEARTPY